MIEYKCPLSEEEMAFFLEGDEDDLGELLTEILDRLDDPHDGSSRALEQLVYGGMPSERYYYDDGSAEISHVTFNPGTRLSGKIEIDFTASLHLGCRDHSDIAAGHSNTVDFRIEQDPPTLVVWDTEKPGRDTVDEF